MCYFSVFPKFTDVNLSYNFHTWEFKKHLRMNSLPTIPSRTVTNLETVGVVTSKIYKMLLCKIDYFENNCNDMFKYNSNNNVLA